MNRYERKIKNLNASLTAANDRARVYKEKWEALRDRMDKHKADLLHCPEDNPVSDQPCLMLTTLNGLCEAYRLSFQNGMDRLDAMQKQIDKLTGDCDV